MFKGDWIFRQQRVSLCRRFPGHGISGHIVTYQRRQNLAPGSRVTDTVTVGSLAGTLHRNSEQLMGAHDASGPA